MSKTNSAKSRSTSTAGAAGKAPAPKAAKARTARPFNWIWLDLGLLVLLIFAVYANGLKGDFVFDDQQIVLQNPVVQHIENWGDAIRSGGGWRQALYLTYGLNFLWGGLDSFNYHVTNVLIHALNVILIYFIIRRIAAPQHARIAAVSGAAVFAVHTLLSSGVSYITARSSTMCALFYFLAILCFMKGDRAATVSAVGESGYWPRVAGISKQLGWLMLAAVCLLTVSLPESIPSQILLIGCGVLCLVKALGWRGMAVFCGLLAWFHPSLHSQRR
jgi:hypothetical protein